MSTKISRELMRESINALLDESNRSHRKFTETVEMQIALKNINPHKDKPASGTFRVKHSMKPNFKVCVIGDPEHCDEAKAKKVNFIDMDTVRLMRKKSSIAKRIIKKYDGFLASTTIIKDVTNLVGPMMKRMGKLPMPLAHGDNLYEKILESKTTMTFQMKRVLWLAVCVGHVKMTPDMLAENIDTAIRSLLTLLKKDWQNIRSIHLKSTMGRPQRIY
ncbi:60S ribosomal protein L10a [Rhipicephalus sanguineus]|uniref:60S ribosomal protein L10a n=1 Tax=Rhipicephalus sanguineus TaxID=34632 RepID=UPI0018932599|nr:60S ribosomal protein L10a [Rhipicephalus sanguineus]